MRQDDTVAVQRLGRGIRWGLLGLVALSVGVFVAVVSMLSAFREHVQAVQHSSVREQLAMEVVYGVRTVQLSRTDASSFATAQVRGWKGLRCHGCARSRIAFGVGQEYLLGVLREMKRLHNALASNTLSESAASFMSEPSLEVHQLLSEPGTLPLWRSSVVRVHD